MPQAAAATLLLPATAAVLLPSLTAAIFLSVATSTSNCRFAAVLLLL